MPIANTSQLGLARLGQLQLGVVEPNAASNDRTGTSAVTAPAATLTASGTIVNAYTGTSAVTAAAATMAATGTVVNPATNTGRLMLLGIG
jgi:hypothetical protein